MLINMHSWAKTETITGNRENSVIEEFFSYCSTLSRYGRDAKVNIHPSPHLLNLTYATQQTLPLDPKGHVPPGEVGGRGAHQSDL